VKSLRTWVNKLAVSPRNKERTVFWSWTPTIEESHIHDRRNLDRGTRCLLALPRFFCVYELCLYRVGLGPSRSSKPRNPRLPPWSQPSIYQSPTSILPPFPYTISLILQNKLYSFIHFNLQIIQYIPSKPNTRLDNHIHFLQLLVHHHRDFVFVLRRTTTGPV